MRVCIKGGHPTVPHHYHCYHWMAVLRFVGVAIFFFSSLSPLLSIDAYQQAQEHLNDGHYTEAQSLFVTLLSDHPEDETLYIQYAFSYEQQGDYEEAINILKGGIEHSERYTAHFYYNLGNGYFALRNYDEAERHYGRAIQNNALFLPPYVNRANLRVRQRDYRGALEDYSHYITQQPNGEQNGEIRGMIVILRSIIGAEERQKREELERQERLLQDALRSLEGADQEGVFAPGEGENVKDLDDPLDIVE